MHSYQYNDNKLLKIISPSRRDESKLCERERVCEGGGVVGSCMVMGLCANKKVCMCDARKLNRDGNNEQYQ